MVPIITGIHAKNRQKARESDLEEKKIGILEIPKIDVHLPIYPSVSEQELESGVGHIPESNWIDEGTNSHCLIAGHRGLPGTVLLAKLHEMEEGDYFYVTQKMQTYRYQVCQIQVIRPQDTEKLITKEDGEFVSLITCTPYGIHTHRLIVTGRRMEE